MKIAMLHWGFPPIIGGVETHLSLLGPGLIKKGHRVDLLTGSVNNYKVDYKYRGIKIRRSPLFDLNWLFERGLEDLGKEIANLTEAFLDASKPDIIHAHNMHYFSKIHTRALDNYARKNKIPLVLTAHNVWDEGSFLDLSLDIGWTHIIAVSEYIKSELMGIGLSGDKITVVYHGIDINKFKKQKSSAYIFKKYPSLKNKRIIFHPARLGLAKGCDVSLKALRLIKEKVPKAMLILTGTKNTIDWGTTQQKDIAYILHLIKKLGIEKNVLIQMIPLDLMPKFYNIADVSVYPSTGHEPFGITMLESLASGVPMVVTESGGMVEVIENGINGFIVKTRDYKGLAERCTEILKNGDLRRELGKNGKVLVREKYAKEIMVDNTLKVYEKDLKSQRERKCHEHKTERSYVRNGRTARIEGAVE